MRILLAVSIITFFAIHAAAQSADSKKKALREDWLFMNCLVKTLNVRPAELRDPVNPDRAFDPTTGRNFFYDKDKEQWIDAKTGEAICPKTGSAGPNVAALYEDWLFMNCLVKTLNVRPAELRDPVNPDRAFDPTTGRNFFYDKDKEAWVDSKTGEQVCPPPTAPKTKDGVKTASVPARFELGLGYSYMHPDAEVVKDLNGFNVSGFYNVNSWLAFGGEFSGLYGTATETRQFMVGDMKKDFDVKTSLDRYLYLFGPQVMWHPCEHAKVFGHVLVGGVHDRNEVSFPDGSMRSSADAFALAVGAGVDFQVTRHFSVGPSFDYVPTHFTSPTGDNWQNNWRVGVVGKISF